MQVSVAIWTFAKKIAVITGQVFGIFSNGKMSETFVNQVQQL